MPLYSNPRTGQIVDEHHRVIGRLKSVHAIERATFDPWKISGRMIDLCGSTGRWGAASLTTWDMIHVATFGAWSFDGDAAFPTCPPHPIPGLEEAIAKGESIEAVSEEIFGLVAGAGDLEEPEEMQGPSSALDKRKPPKFEAKLVTDIIGDHKGMARWKVFGGGDEHQIQIFGFHCEMVARLIADALNDAPPPVGTLS